MAYTSFLVLLIILAIPELVQGERLTGCYSEQFVEFATKDYIRCQFPPDFVAVYWFDNATDAAKPVLAYKNSEKLGTGFESGEFDILPNGSLIISNVTLRHERVFKTICFTSNDIFSTFRIAVTVTVHPNEEYPYIQECDKSMSVCILQKNANCSLTCTVRGTRPPARLEWFHRIGNREEKIESSFSIQSEGNFTFDCFATLDVCNDHVSHLDIVICEAKMGTETWKSRTVLLDLMDYKEQTSIDFYPIYEEKFKKVIMPCMQGQTILWKRILSNKSETIAYITPTTRKTIQEQNGFTLSGDGTLVIRSFTQYHEGNYICTSSSGTTQDAMGTSVYLIVRPWPSYIQVEGCPTQYYCVITSTGEGTLVCQVSRVRPKVSLTWTTTNGDKIQLTKKNSSTSELFGLYSTKSVLSYKLDENMKCEDVVHLTCQALGPATMLFSPNRPIRIQKETCAIGGSFSSPIEETNHSAIVIPVVTVALAMIGVLIIGFIHKFKKRREFNEARNNDSGELMTLMPETEKRVQFIESLKLYYRANTVRGDLLYEDNYLRTKCKSKSYIKPSPAIVLKSFRELFTSDTFKDKNIFIEGESGYGKSFMAYVIIHEWLFKTKKSPLQDFHIVLSLPLNDFDNCDFYEFVVRELLPKDTKLTAKDVEKILHKEEKFLILFDNFERYPQKMLPKSNVFCIINKKNMVNAKVILMSRPTSLTEHLVDGIELLQLQSLRHEQVVTYLEKALIDRKDLFLKLTTVLSKYDKIKEMLTIPLMLSTTTSHFEQDEDSINSVTNITSFLRLIMQVVLSEDPTQAGDKEASARISKIALEYCIDGEDSAHGLFIDSEGGITEIKERLIKSGILVKKELLGNRKKEIAQFSHAMYREFYGALHLANVESSTLDTYLQRMDILKCQQLLIFTCGLCDKEDNLKMIMKKLLATKDAYPFPVRNCIVYCLQEISIAAIKQQFLKEFCEKEHAMQIHQNDGNALIQAKASVINFCAEKNIQVNILSLMYIVKEISRGIITLETGIKITIPKDVVTYFLIDMNGNVDGRDIVSLLENNDHLKEIIVYSNVTPTHSHEDNISMIHEKKVKVAWITYLNGIVVNFNYPSAEFRVWLDCLETSAIKLMRKFEGWDIAVDPHQERGEMQQAVEEIKRKGVDACLVKYAKKVSEKDRKRLYENVEENMKQLGDVIKHWHLLFEASLEEKQELSNRFRKLVTSFKKRVLREERRFYGYNIATQQTLRRESAYSEVQEGKKELEPQCKSVTIETKKGLEAEAVNKEKQREEPGDINKEQQEKGKVGADSPDWKQPNEMRLISSDLEKIFTDIQLRCLKSVSNAV